VDKQADAIRLLLPQLEESIMQVKPLLEGERNPPPP
jgi:hypothetical protein